MAIELTPDTKVRRDANGIVRQLSHSRQYRPSRSESFSLTDPSPLTPRALAEQYLRETASLFGFAPEETANFAAEVSMAPTVAGVELRFKEEKTVGTGVTVAYDQTVYSLPIWDAGVAVRIDGKQMGVTGAHNATHYDINVKEPRKNARYLPHQIDLRALRRLLGLKAKDAELTINGTRALVYRFRLAERYDSQIDDHRSPDESTGLAGLETVDFPTLSLPPVPNNIQEDKHYVVTEALFSYPYPNWGRLNWRAFIEPKTGAVLYLRALVSCAHGAVFATDPVSNSGILHSASTAPDVLNALRSSLPLLGLKAPNLPGNKQELAGEYVRLVNLDSPNTSIPSENSPFNFDYSCNTGDFAACNAYYHCDGVFRFIQSLGIDVNSYFNNTDFPVPVDPHALGGRVNAQAPGNSIGNGLGRLAFGVAKSGTTFGIAADVRVVIHEFGHGVLWDHVNAPNFGFAHSPGDSLGVILHDPHSKAPDRFETFPFMNQSTGLSRRHDRDVTQGWGWFGRNWNPEYGGEQVLSTTLFRVYRAAGGDAPDMTEKLFASRYMAYLILKGVSLLSFTTRDPDVYVDALTEADATSDVFEGHPGGAFGKVIRWSFEKQGLYQPADFRGPVTRPGNPPDVDVYIEDGRQGEYMPYLADFRGNAEIWNRTVADGETQHQDPVIGVPGFAYIRVRNRGTQPAKDLSVRGFLSRTPQATRWPMDWKPLPDIPISTDKTIEPGEALIIGPFSWTPQAPGDNLLFGVSAAGDQSHFETINSAPILNARLVPLDNNIAQRAF